jgi:predicted MPP superfamily phosphohydrolase
MHKGPHGRLIISRGLANTVSLVPRIGNPTEIVYVFLTGEDKRERRGKEGTAAGPM